MASRTIYINFGSGSNTAPAPWDTNYFTTADATATGVLKEHLLDSTGNSTLIGFERVSAFDNAGGDGGGATVGSGDWNEAVFDYFHYFDAFDAMPKDRLIGLSEGQTYTIEFAGHTAGGTDRVTDVTIDDVTQTYTPSGTTTPNAPITFTGTVTGSFLEIDYAMSVTYGYLSGLKITITDPIDVKPKLSNKKTWGSNGRNTTTSIDAVSVRTTTLKTFPVDAVINSITSQTKWTNTTTQRLKYLIYNEDETLLAETEINGSNTGDFFTDTELKLTSPAKVTAGSKYRLAVFGESPSAKVSGWSSSTHLATYESPSVSVFPTAPDPQPMTNQQSWGREIHIYANYEVKDIVGVDWGTSGAGYDVTVGARLGETESVTIKEGYELTAFGGIFNTANTGDQTVDILLYDITNGVSNAPLLMTKTLTIPNSTDYRRVGQHNLHINVSAWVGKTVAGAVSNASGTVNVMRINTSTNGSVGTGGATWDGTSGTSSVEPSVYFEFRPIDE